MEQQHIASRVYVSNTATNLYKAAIHALHRKSQGDDSTPFLIFVDSESAFTAYAERLDQLGIFEQHCVIPEIFTHSYIPNPLRRVLEKRRVIRDKVRERLGGCPFLDNSPGQEIVIFTPRHPMSLHLLYSRSNSFRLMEDGTGNYFELDPPPKQKLFWALSDLFIFGKFGDVNRKLGAIEMRLPELVPAEYRQQVVPFDLEKMTDALTAYDRSRLVDFFTGSLHLDVESDGRRLLLLTQPFAEIGLCTHEEKIAVYQRVLDEHGEDYELFIKPHPRETDDYSTAFRQAVTLLPQTFPAEILNLVDGPVFDLGIAISSTALDESTYINEKRMLGLEWDERLVRKEAQVHSAFR